MKSLLKSIIVLGASVALLTGCGNHVDFKSDEDRKTFTKVEMEEVEKEIQAIEGVESFGINHAEGGVYAVLTVEDKAVAKDLAVEAFQSMWAETTGIVDLFVKEVGTEDILIQAFKPAGTDKENKWDILL